MLTEPRSIFLMVRSYAALESAHEELAAYLSIIRNLSPGHELEALQGIWVDEDGVANLPCTLILRDASGAQRTVRILEAMGINGIWMLCWLEVAANTVSRGDLVAALLECFGHDDTARTSARFIPVFTDKNPDSSVDTELQMLEARYPGIVLRPIYQESDGRLVLPSSQSQAQGT